MQIDLAGEVAFVCGSSSGIGQAIALALARNGCDIILNGRNPETARESMEKIKRIGRKVIFEKADMNEYYDLKKGVEHSLQEFGHIDILIGSGGFAGSGLKSDFFIHTDPMSYLQWAKRWCSRLNIVKAVSDHMIERQRGKILLIGTDAGRWPTPAECLAGGTGAALVLSTKVLAQELSQWKIRINTICLTAIEDTPSYNYATQQSESLKAIFKKVLSKQPFRVTPEDVAKAALFFCSDASQAITGQILSINGGLSFPG